MISQTIGNTLRFATFALALLLSLPSVAQQKAPPPSDPAAVAAAKELLIAMGSMKQFEVAINTMSRGMADAFKKQAPAKGKEIDEVMGLMASKFNARKEEMLAMVAPLYAEKFTVGELTEIGNFYKTPIGQKMISTQPEILQRSMQLGMVWGQSIGQEVEVEARKELKKRGVDL
jgi:uncharacterized protein